jgi:Smg protein
MFDVLVYLYETYQQSDACPDSEALTKKLSSIGFEEDEISRALDWLKDLTQAAHGLSNSTGEQASGFRIYAEQESRILGSAVIGFVHFLELANVLSPMQREVVVERALAASDTQISLEKFKVIVLMVLWSQGKEPDSLVLDELFLDSEEPDLRLLH